MDGTGQEPLQERRLLWVSANVTPVTVMEAGRIVGHMSVRLKPSRSEVNTAQARYRKLQAGDPQKLTINQGEVFGAGFRSQLAHMCHLSLSWRTKLGMGNAT